MCRLSAYLGPTISLADLLFAPPHGLEHQAYAPARQLHGTMNADGFGAAWWDREVGDAPIRYRRDIPIWNDRNLASMAPGIRSGAFVAAVRGATAPLPVEESSTPPYIADGWALAHNGSIEGFHDGVGTALRALCGHDIIAGGAGPTDSELLLGLFIDRLRGGAAPPTAMAEAVGLAASHAPGSRLNLVASDGHTVVASRHGDTLFTLETSVAGQPAVFVASEPHDDDPAWCEVPDHHIVTADAVGVATIPIESLRHR